MIQPDLQAMLQGNAQGQQMANGVAPSNGNPSGMPQAQDPSAPLLDQMIDTGTDFISSVSLAGAPNSEESKRVMYEVINKLQGLKVQRQRALAKTISDSASP